MQPCPLKPNLARQYFPQQTPVAKKAEFWILEGGGFVMFKAEMPDPGERVASH
jgi:hypothetical protein